MALVAPSMLSADFLSLAKDVRTVNAHADLFHLDIMDGTFVPNISFGFPVVEAIAKLAEVPMDAHLMIVNPEKYVERFAKTGVSMLSFHLEATRDKADKVIDLIHSCGMKAGMAINPDIPVEDLYPYLDKLDFVLIMSVFAGFGGQSFIETTYSRIKTLKAEMDRRGLDIPIEVDGGVSLKNTRLLQEAGASILVAGSSVFKAEDPGAMMEQLR